MATKRDLKNYVDYLNDKYCKNTKNHLEISQAYGGYSVELTGKTNKRTGRPLKGSLGYASSYVGNQYHDTSTNTIRGLSMADSRGWIKSAIKQHEPKRNRNYSNNFGKRR